MNEQLERDVREMLRRRAGDVTTAPDAWSRINERITGDGPASVLELAPRRTRFTRPLVLGSIAAALLLVVASVAILQAGDRRQTIRTADDPSSAPAPPPTAAPVPEPAFEATAELVAREWVALAAGAGDGAWDLLAQQSRDSIGGRSGFDAHRRELAEEWAAWAEASDVSYRSVSLTADPSGLDGPPAELPRLGVVIITGRVAQGGATAVRTVSLPVRGTKNKAMVDPFSNVGIELFPDPVFKGDRISSRTTLGAFTPSGAKVWFVLDDRDVVGPDDSADADGDQQHVTFSPVPPLGSGQHSYTVVVLTVDGRVASRSTTYTVA